ncbi:MAG: ribonuclease Z [Moraxella sp.]|nr:ribonuclease Z [Moraxella sp.]
MFRLTFLGTSSGVPTDERNVSAVVVECMQQNTAAKNHPWILVDCGEGTQHQILRSSLSFTYLQAILITHVHGDHCYGLPGLLASLGMHGRKAPLAIIAPQAILTVLTVLKQATQWHVSYDICFFAIEDLLTQNANDTDGYHYRLTLNDGHIININIYELSHRCPSYGFALHQELSKQNLDTQKLDELGIHKTAWRHILQAQNASQMQIGEHTLNPKDFIINQHKQLKIVIAGDNDNPSLLSQAVKDATALVHEATYTDNIRQKILSKPTDQGGFDPKHSSVKMVAEFAQRQHIPMLILTHFSARYALFEDIGSKRPNMAHIKDEACQYYDGALVLAKDFLQVVID